MKKSYLVKELNGFIWQWYINIILKMCSCNHMFMFNGMKVRLVGIFHLCKVKFDTSTLDFSSRHKKRKKEKE